MRRLFRILKKSRVARVLMAIFMAKALDFLFRKTKKINFKNNFHDFLESELKEKNELEEHKENIVEYCHDSYNIFRDYFLPCDCNGHKPKILRPKSLAVLVTLVFAIKVAAISYLFFIYPNDARMSELITQETVRLINEARSEEKLELLGSNAILDSVALEKAQDMINNNYFAHKSVDGRMPWDFIDRDKYSYQYVGENLAMNFTSAESAHNALMLSPSHKRNIMNPKYSEVGVAVLSGNINGQKTNVMVEIFATRKNLNIAKKSDVKFAGTTVLTDSKTQENLLVQTPVIEKEKIVVAASEKISEKNENTEKQELAKVKNNKMNENKIADVKSDLVQNSVLEEKDESADSKVKTKKIVNIDVAEGSVLGDKKNHLASFSENIGLNQKMFLENEDTSRVGGAINIIKLAKYFLLSILTLLVISLVINIFVKIGIQHKPVLAQATLAIVVLIGIYMLQFHLVENIGSSVIIS